MKILSIITILFLTLGVMPVYANGDAIHVGNDGPVILTLNQDAGSVIVGNPMNATVTLQSPRRLLINAGQAGMTRLMVLNNDGETILQRDLVVGSGGHGVIRIQNACINAGDMECNANVTYDCMPGERCNRVQAAPPPQGYDNYDIQGSGAPTSIEDANARIE